MSSQVSSVSDSSDTNGIFYILLWHLFFAIAQDRKAVSSQQHAGANNCQRSLHSMYLINKGNFSFPCSDQADSHHHMRWEAQQLDSVIPVSFDERKQPNVQSVDAVRPPPHPTPPHASAIVRQQAPCSAESQEASWQQR